MKTEPWPFVIRIASTLAQMQEVRQVRWRAYGRHSDVLGSLMLQPDEADTAEDCRVLVAIDKAKGVAVGTVRLQFNDLRPLGIETSLPELATRYQSCRVAEATRLAVACEGEDCDPALVRLGLLKAVYLCCMAGQVYRLIVGARTRALVRGYERLGFEHEAQGMVVLNHAGNMPHYVLSLELSTLEAAWRKSGNALHSFWFSQTHRDIQILASGHSASSEWTSTRAFESEVPA